MLKDIVKGRDMTSTQEALKKRKKEGNKYSRRRANFFSTLIRRIKNKRIEWNTEEIN